MIIVDNELQRRAENDNPIRVGMIGAGFMARGIANQIINSVPGMSKESIIPQMAKVDNIELSLMFWINKIQNINYFINRAIIVFGDSINDLQKYFKKVKYSFE